MAKRRGDYNLYEKMNNLKSRLKVLSKEIFGWIDLKVEEKIEEQHQLDQNMITNFGGDVGATVEERRLVTKQIWKHLELKDCILRLKSGQNWLKEGDLNTRLFHNSLKSRMRKNSISLVNTNDGMVEGAAKVKFYIRQHFINFFKEPCFNRLVPGGASRGW